eukprot:3746549-Prymnesium_polylepis.1
MFTARIASEPGGRTCATARKARYSRREPGPTTRWGHACTLRARTAAGPSSPPNDCGGVVGRAGCPIVCQQAPGSWHPRDQPASLSAGNRLGAREVPSRPEAPNFFHVFTPPQTGGLGRAKPSPTRG